MNPNRMFPLALAAVLSPVLAVPASTSAAETLADWAWDRTGATCLGALSGDSADWDGSSRCLGDRLGGLGRAAWLAATVAGLLMSFFRRNSIAITAAVLGFIFARAVKRASARRSADHAEIRLSPLVSRPWPHACPPRGERSRSRLSSGSAARSGSRSSASLDWMTSSRSAIRIVRPNACRGCALAASSSNAASCPRVFVGVPMMTSMSPWSVRHVDTSFA